MADQTATMELDSIALQIYSARIANTPRNVSGETVALDSYRKAEAFLAAKAKVAKGALRQEKIAGPRLAEFCTPNLPKTHPHNLVASTGNAEADASRLKKIRDVFAWLTENKPPS